MIIHVYDCEPIKFNSPYRNEYADNYRYLAYVDLYPGLPGVYAKTEEEAVIKLMKAVTDEKERITKAKQVVNK